MNKKVRCSKRWKILVTPKEAADSLDFLPAKLLGEVEFVPTYGRVENLKRLADLLRDKDGVVLDIERITDEVFKRCPGLKVISRFGEGCDAIDLGSAKRFNVKVARTQRASSHAVARHTMSLVLSLTHHIVENDRNLKRGLWIRNPNLSEEAATLGILGFGKIGKAVADLASAFGFKALVYSRRKKITGYRYATDIETLIRSSDILSIHLPYTPETRRIVSRRIIMGLKGKYLVNTARGGVVDEKALLESLSKEDGLLGYATDVFCSEPVSGISSKLAKHPKVVCTPHIAALDKITNIRVTERAVRNALYCLNNEHEKVISYVVR